MSTTNSITTTKILLAVIAIAFLISANNAFALDHLKKAENTDNTTTDVRKVDVQRVDINSDKPQPVKALDRVKSFSSDLIKSSGERKANEEIRKEAADRASNLRANIEEKESDLRRDAENKKTQANTKLDERRGDLAEKKDDRAETLESKRAELENRKAQREAEIDERRQERQEQLSERSKRRVEAYVLRLVNRMNAAVERLRELMVRVDSRITKFEERGVDVSEAKRFSAVAKEEIAKADSAVKDAAQSVRDALAGNDPQNQRDVINSKFRVAKDAIVEAHKAVISAVRALKASVDTNSDTDDSNVEN
ncbi:MAG: hypothetical protein ISR99_00240 [Parcubacteria group bacterium]|nr:hypothetical protein [Parcubacteria group bacterium]